MSYPRPRIAACPICGEDQPIKYYHAGYGYLRCCYRDHPVLHNSSTNYFQVKVGDYYPSRSIVVVAQDTRGRFFAYMTHLHRDGRYPSRYAIYEPCASVDEAAAAAEKRWGDHPIFLARTDCVCNGQGTVAEAGFHQACDCLTALALSHGD